MPEKKTERTPILCCPGEKHPEGIRVRLKAWVSPDDGEEAHAWWHFSWNNSGTVTATGMEYDKTVFEEDLATLPTLEVALTVGALVESLRHVGRAL